MVVVTSPPFKSMSLAVTAMLSKGAVLPIGPPRITLAAPPPAVTVSARGVETSSLLTLDARVMTAAASLAVSVVSLPRVTASP